MNSPHLVDHLGNAKVCICLHPILSLAKYSWRKHIKQAIIALAWMPLANLPGLIKQPGEHQNPWTVTSKMWKASTVSTCFLFYVLTNHPLLQMRIPLWDISFSTQEIGCWPLLPQTLTLLFKTCLRLLESFWVATMEIFYCFSLCPFFCRLDLSIQCLANTLFNYSLEIPGEKVTECYRCGKDKNPGTNIFASYFLFSTRCHVIFV